LHAASQCLLSCTRSLYNHPPPFLPATLCSGCLNGCLLSLKKKKYIKLCRFSMYLGNIITHTYERAARLDTWLTPRLVSGNNMKKCRARYGLDQQSQWCKPCRCVPLFFHFTFVTLCTSLVLVLHAPGVNNLFLSLTGVSRPPRTRSASMRRVSGSADGGRHCGVARPRPRRNLCRNAV
jgi:hypothetical protein